MLRFFANCFSGRRFPEIRPSGRRGFIEKVGFLLSVLALAAPVRADPGAQRNFNAADKAAEAPSGDYPRSDLEAASRVVRTGRENRPDNAASNHNVPTPAQLKQIEIPEYIGARGRATFGRVTGDFSGTTDEILQWGAYKWGFDPDLVRANAVDESFWHQNMVGDIDNGVSLGIMQIKSKYHLGTCPASPRFPPSVDAVEAHAIQRYLAGQPSCLSFNFTAFSVDYRLAHLRACMNKSIRYLFNHEPASGHARYADAIGDELLWGCVGSWYSGYFWDAEAIAYVERVRRFYEQKPWLDASF
ncbi:hypothetical protein [Methylobacterium nigriterrae]|uniref:hypothetical protein n=1 Tax=Methylobacterium nigriterrae TaxID=3127512 RepID=UPI00301406CB